MSPLSKRGHVRALQRVPRFARYHPPRTYLGKTAHRAVATFASMSLMYQARCAEAAKVFASRQRMLHSLRCGEIAPHLNKSLFRLAAETNRLAACAPQTVAREMGVRLSPRNDFAISPELSCFLLRRFSSQPHYSRRAFCDGARSVRTAHFGADPTRTHRIYGELR